jgi:hypothetical protein
MKRIEIFLGGYGSGKTELAINRAMELQSEGKKIAIADLDIVNMYFRSRDIVKQFENLGIKVIIPEGKYSAADTPFIPAALRGYILNEEYHLILDVGGDPDGARVLGVYRDELKSTGYTAYFVINASRPFAHDINELIELIKAVEFASGINIKYLINNTNFAEFTQEKDLIKGMELTETIAKKLDKEFLYSSIWDKLNVTIESKYPIKKIKRYMLKPWETK